MSRKKPIDMGIRWNYTNKALIAKKGFGKQLNQYIADTILNYSIDYTPLGPEENKKGLKHILEVADTYATSYYGYITYEGLPYVNYQYTADDSTWNRYTEGTTSEWIDYTWDIHRKEIEQKIDARRKQLSK